MRSVQTLLPLLVRLAFSICALAFVLGNVQQVYALLSSSPTSQQPALSSPGGLGAFLGGVGGVDQP